MAERWRLLPDWWEPAPAFLKTPCDRDLADKNCSCVRFVILLS
jgi:hypothetical protein